MKKTAVILIVLLAVVAGSVLWVRSQIGITDPALLLPQSTAVYAAIPDVPRAAMRWPNTTLSKISGEKEMRDFLEKPFSQMAKGGGKDAAGILLSLKPGRLFAAVLTAKGASVESVVGFQFWGSRGDFDKAISRLRTEIHQGKEPEVLREKINGTEISSSAMPDGSQLFTAAQGRWGFLANSREALLAVIERAAGRDATPALAEDPAFKTCLSKMPIDPDVLIFLRPGTLMDALLTVGNALGAQADPNQVEQIRKAEAVSFCLKMDGANLRDAIFVLRQSPADLGKLTHVGMSLTSPQTLGYFDFLLQFEALAGMAKNPATQKYVPQPINGEAPLLQRLPEAFEREASVSFSWPVEKMTPELLITSSVKDPVKAESVLMEIVSYLPETTITEKAGAKFYGFPTLRSTFLDPTLAVTPDLFVLAMNPAEAEAALARRNAPQTLEQSPAFAPALETFRTANESFGFLDTKGLFERAFPLLRQVIVFGVAFTPGASDLIDAEKLPQTETIAKHLTPIVYSQTRLPEGYLIESSGPITMNQAAILAMGAGATILGPQLFPQN
jgi:hypothetical protein